MEERTEHWSMEQPSQTMIDMAIRKIGSKTRTQWIELLPVRVTVRRTSGEIEYDWWVIARQEREDLFAVMQQHSKAVKSASLEDLRELNPRLPSFTEAE